MDRPHVYQETSMIRYLERQAPFQAGECREMPKDAAAALVRAGVAEFFRGDERATASVRPRGSHDPQDAEA